MPAFYYSFLKSCEYSEQYEQTYKDITSDLMVVRMATKDMEQEEETASGDIFVDYGIQLQNGVEYLYKH